MMEFMKKKKESTDLVANFHLALVANAKNPCKLGVYKGFCGPDGTRIHEMQSLYIFDYL